MYLRLHWQNAYIYFVLYFIASFVAMKVMPKNKKQKVLTYVPTANLKEKKLVRLSGIFRIITFILSVFVPVKYGSWNFYIGTILYLLGLILTTLSLWQFSRAAFDKPITTGLYKSSRHPMQVMFYLLCIGVVVATANMYLLISVSIYIAFSYPMMAMQEKYCTQKYGTVYSEYMKDTPRMFFIK